MGMGRREGMCLGALHGVGAISCGVAAGLHHSMISKYNEWL